MANFPSLPDELLLMIFRNVQDHRDVVSLALQNKRFHALSDLKTRRKFRRTQSACDTDMARALKMLLLILKRPHLGEYVRHLKIDCGRGCRDEDPLREEDLEPEDVERLKQAIRNAGFVEEEVPQMMEAMFPKVEYLSFTEGWHPTMEALAALLASVSPRLESITCCDLGYYMEKESLTHEEPKFVQLTADGCGSPGWFGQFIQRAGQSRDPVPYLQHLRTVRFIPDTSALADERFFEENDFWHGLNVFRRLPAIESLRYDAMCDSEQHMTIPPPPRRGNYTHLEFRNCFIRFHVMAGIIESARTLKHLTWTTGGRSSLEGGIAVMVRDWLTPLLLHRHTLEYLDLDTESVTWLRQERERPRQEDEETAAWEKERFESEWAGELQEPISLPLLEERTASETPVRSLRSLYRLEHLGLGASTLCILAQGVGADKVDSESFSLVDHLRLQVRG
jgi:hypothetical protein